MSVFFLVMGFLLAESTFCVAMFVVSLFKLAFAIAQFAFWAGAAALFFAVWWSAEFIRGLGLFIWFIYQEWKALREDLLRLPPPGAK